MYKGCPCNVYLFKEVFSFFMQGTVKFFHDQKNYGFIEVEDQEDDIFFHISNVEGEEALEEGTEVEFEEEEGDKGPEAVNVTEA